MNKWSAIVLVVVLFALVDAKKMKNNKAAKGMFTNPFFSLPLTVGSQKTTLNVSIDGYYGSSLVYGKDVACDGSDYYCVQHATFDHTASSSFKVAVESRSFEFTLGTADGLSGSDDISVGSLKLKKAMFGVAESIPRHLNRKTKNSGHLAMNAPESDPMEKTTMQLIVEQASAPQLTFYAPADMNGEHAVTIGSEDTTHCKKNWERFDNKVSVASPKRKPWTVNWSAFKWGSYAKTEKLNVALNPASDFFVAPRRHANYIYKQLNAQYSYDYSGGMVDCAQRSSAPNIEFTAGGRKLIVTPKQYIKMFDSSHCLLNIYPDELDQWTMPYMFFQKYCVKFDYGAKTVSVADQK